MAFVIGFPWEPQHSSIHPLSGEFPHQVRLELHGIPSYLPNMEVTACRGTFEHACEEAALRMMAHLRELHDDTLNTTAYCFHPCRGSSSNTGTFKSAWRENDVTFGHMSEVMEGYNKLHAMLHRATKRLNDKKLVRIAELQDENSCLKKQVARLQGCPPPGGARIRTMPRKLATAPVRIQLAPRNPPPPPPAAPAPVQAPAPAPTPAYALSFVPASAYRGPMVNTRNGSRAAGEGSSSKERTDGGHPNSPSSNGPPPLPENPTLAQVMAHQTQMMAAMMQQRHQQMHQRMQQQADQQQQFGPPTPQSKLLEFLRVRPPIFSSTTNPLEAKD
uniref:Retrotransposon protein, putative, Ty3-gypsy sub-class n=2 Tax=Oryza sativa subsp. japonica TaxID=39947 RepID=Q2R5Y7_ORYSJ|nr:retrotransposon protein, putative, Ty3-gypsy sub-class [Oryza sativa Japonica Group]ABA93077.1 retrotransposon protein, putative, Ty3-gypsy subclass [Oryza sativa Japonica Group]